MRLSEYDLFAVFIRKDRATKRTVNIADVLSEIASILGGELSNEENQTL